MPKYYHVTKLAHMRAIQSSGLKPSTGAGAQGMSSDSGESYKYTEQDIGHVYLWTSVDYTGNFKKAGIKYACLEVEVSGIFDQQHLDVTPKAKASKDTTKHTRSATTTTLVCDAPISTAYIYYYKSKEDFDAGRRRPIAEWGRFDIAKEARDEQIWEGERA